MTILHQRQIGLVAGPVRQDDFGAHVNFGFLLGTASSEPFFAARRPVSVLPATSSGAITTP
jgi:hypothetical protein